MQVPSTDLLAHKLSLIIYGEYCWTFWNLSYDGAIHLKLIRKYPVKHSLQVISGLKDLHDEFVFIH